MVVDVQPSLADISSIKPCNLLHLSSFNFKIITISNPHTSLSLQGESYTLLYVLHWVSTSNFFHLEVRTLFYEISIVYHYLRYIFYTWKFSLSHFHFIILLLQILCNVSQLFSCSLSFSEAWAITLPSCISTSPNPSFEATMHTKKSLSMYVPLV